MLKVRIVLLLAVGVGLVPLTSGHDLYLVSGVKGAEGAVCARIGEAFPESEGAVTADRLESFRVVSVKGALPLKGAVRDKQFCAGYEGAGAAVAEMVVHPRFIKLAAKDFNQYVAGEGLKPISAARRGGGADREGRELYSRYAKLLLGPADEAHTRALGHVLEIVPEKPPATLRPGEALPVRVLFQGKPLPDTQVAAVYAGAVLKGHEYPVIARTDQQGRAILKLDQRGLWYARLIHMIPAQGDPDVDWRSFFATMVFQTAK